MYAGHDLFGGTSCGENDCMEGEICVGEEISPGEICPSRTICLWGDSMEERMCMGEECVGGIVLGECSEESPSECMLCTSEVETNAVVVRVNMEGDSTTLDSQLGSPGDIAVHSDFAFVVDLTEGGVVRVNLTTGEILSVSCASGGMVQLQRPVGISIEENGNLLVVDSELLAVVRLDPNDGSCTIVSQGRDPLAPDAGP